MASERGRTGWFDRLAAGAAAVLRRPLTDGELEQFEKYLSLLRSWQRVHRLVGSGDPDWIVRNLFLDSLAFLPALPRMVDDLVDIGSGAGIPGIPIKITSPAMRLTMIEARERRVSFLRSAVRELGLTDAAVIGQRAEEVVRTGDGRHDAAVARCAGDVAAILPLAEALVRPGGVVVLGAAESAPVPQGAERLVVDVPGLGPRWLFRRRRPPLPGSSAETPV